MHTLKKLTRLTQKGDTIVEVMIVLAVLGLAISISYATANRSLINTRQALENSQATEYVQSQAEALQSIVCPTANTNCAPQGALFATAPTYCINTSVTPFQQVIIAHPDTRTSASYGACAQGIIPYYLTIKYSNSPTDTFTITATWDDAQGEGVDTVTTIYRIHQGATLVGGDIGGGHMGGGGGAISIATIAKQCGVIGMFGGASYSGDVQVTGTPNLVTKIHVVSQASILGFPLNSTQDIDVKIGPDGTATQHISLGSWFGTATGTATVTDSSGNSSTAQVCP